MAYIFRQMKLNRHPIVWVQDMISRYINGGVLSNRAYLTFSKYKYISRAYVDERVEFDLPIYQLDTSFLLGILMDLEEDEELAFHSRIIDSGTDYHIPLIDFGGKDSRVLESTFKDFSAYWDMDFSLYSSGRSYHAYGNRLLSNQEWIKFMGSLLLLNIPGGAKIIDDRWIGHRLLAGYSALRWSKNGKQYKKYPTHSGYLGNMGFTHGFNFDSIKSEITKSYNYKP